MSERGTKATHPRVSDITIVADPPAARLRFKRQRLRYTRDGETWDYRVVSVSMPDDWGRCTLAVEPIATLPGAPE